MVVNTTESLLGMQKGHIITDSHPLSRRWGCEINIAANTFYISTEWNQQFQLSTTSDCTCGAKAEVYGSDYDAAVSYICSCCAQSGRMSWYDISICNEYMIGGMPKYTDCETGDIPTNNTDVAPDNHEVSTTGSNIPANNTDVGRDDHEVDTSDDTYNSTVIVTTHEGIPHIEWLIAGMLLLAAFIGSAIAIYCSVRKQYQQQTDIAMQPINV
jgi:hypothetical protein